MQETASVSQDYNKNNKNIREKSFKKCKKLKSVNFYINIYFHKAMNTNALKGRT